MSNTITSLVRQLNQRAEDAQTDLLAQGKTWIGDWLRAADKEGAFELALDWLMAMEPIVTLIIIERCLQ